jgi:hypothetical protein
MREFNTLGPVYPEKHYHVDRVAVQDELRAKIEKGNIDLSLRRKYGTM